MNGTTIGHYRVLDKLGEGGMGVVYKAVDLNLGRTVALKVLAPQVLKDGECKVRFMREARAAALLEHANICGVYEVGEDAGRPYLSMAFVEGQNLKEKVAERPLKLDAALDIAIQAAEGLKAAHDKGVVHRDIKSANLMVSTQGQVKVMDFGLAQLAGQSPLTKPGATLGTVGYMAPEIALGKPADRRSDIWSLGVVMYEMLTGRLPFEAANEQAVLFAAVSEPHEPVTALRVGVPTEVDRIIGKALAKDPGERYQYIDEMLVDLRALRRRVQSGEVRLVARRRDRRKLLWTGVGALAAVLAASGFTVFLWFAGSRPALAFSPRDWIFVADFENQTGEPIFDKSLATAFNVSLEQSKHANVFPRSRTLAALRRMGKENAGRIDEELGREICLRENLRGLVTCGIAKVGERYALSARLVNPQNGDTVRSYLEQASGQNKVLDALGKIAASVRRDLGEPLASISQNVRPLYRVTTPSLQALQYYSEATYLWRRNNFQEAVKLYEEALRIDPEFAMAHNALATCYLSHIFSLKEKGRLHLDRAFQLSSRVSERERLLIEIQHSSELGDFDDAVQAFQAYLSAYPDDSATRYSFGTTLMHKDRPEEAIEQFNEVLRVAPEDAPALINLATSYSILDRLPEALSSYAKAFKLEPSWVRSTNLNHEYGFALARAGDTAKAREVFNLALADPKLKAKGLRSHGLLDLYEGKYASAARGFEEAATLSESGRFWLSAARDRVLLSITLKGMGRRAEELRELDAALALLRSEAAAQVWLEARIGAAYARAGALEKANRVLQEVGRKANRQVAAEVADLHLLEGEVLLARGEAARAIEVLSLPDQPSNPLPRRLCLSRALDRNGDSERAMAVRGELIAAGRAIGWEFQQDWIEAHYLQARAYAAKGDRAKAAQFLGVVERLWKSADPSLLLHKQVQQLRVELDRGGGR